MGSPWGDPFDGRQECPPHQIAHGMDGRRQAA